MNTDVIGGRFGRDGMVNNDNSFVEMIMGVLREYKFDGFFFYLISLAYIACIFVQKTYIYAGY